MAGIGATKKVNYCTKVSTEDDSVIITMFANSTACNLQFLKPRLML